MHKRIYIDIINLLYSDIGIIYSANIYILYRPIYSYVYKVVVCNWYTSNS